MRYSTTVLIRGVSRQVLNSYGGQWFGTLSQHLLN
jgi:hypothetical protein